MRRVSLPLVALVFVGWCAVGAAAAPASAAPGWTAYTVCPSDANADAAAGCVCTQPGFDYDKSTNRCVDKRPPNCRAAPSSANSGSATGSLTWTAPPAEKGRTNAPRPQYQWGQYDIRTCPPGAQGSGVNSTGRAGPGG